MVSGGKVNPVTLTPSWPEREVSMHFDLTKENLVELFIIYTHTHGTTHPDTHPNILPTHTLLKIVPGTSLMVQWLRIRLPMQGTWVRALVQEDATCRGATKPLHHNY